MVFHRVFPLAFFSLFLSWTAAGGGEPVLSDPILFNTNSQDSPLVSPRGVTLAEVTGDGNLDAIVVGDVTPGRFAVYPGGGDGSFRSAFASGALDRSTIDVVTGDFNGDGILDIAAVNSACGG